MLVSLVSVALLATLGAADGLDKRRTVLLSNPVQPTAIISDSPTYTLNIINPTGNGPPTLTAPTEPSGSGSGQPAPTGSDTSSQHNTITVTTSGSLKHTQNTTGTPASTTPSTESSAPVSGSSQTGSHTGSEAGASTSPHASTTTSSHNHAAMPTAFGNRAAAGVIALAGLAVAL